MCAVDSREDGKVRERERDSAGDGTYPRCSHSQLLRVELKEVVEARALGEAPNLDALVRPRRVRS